MSVPASLPDDEAERLLALHRLQILDSLPETVFDDIVVLASEICGTPVGLMSLIDTDRQWFKARVGLDATQTPRDQAFCAHAIHEPQQLFTVPDARQDARFAGNPLVLGHPDIRFYAGAPIVTAEGHALGTVCVIDTVPRQLSASQERSLMALARQAAALLRLRELSLAQQAHTEALNRKVTEALASDDAAHAGLQQSQRVASVGQLTSGVAHDFNNLLQTINGNLELIQRKADSPVHVRRWAAGGLATVARGAKLTAQLLAFSRNQLPDAEPLCVVRLVGGMGDLLARAIGPEVRLHFDLAGESVQTVGDAPQLEAAVLNLVINARDAMAGAGRIGISTRLLKVRGDGELADGDYLALRVSDDGPGMPPEIAARAFDPFFTTKQAGKGTGLGLAQVFGFARRAGGVARIASVPGEGTQITLWLRAVAAEAPATASSTAAGAPVSAQGHLRLLLVDDDPGLLATFGELLSEAGYQVRCADSGAGALQMAQQAMPDVVLMDCAMPGMNGAALAAALRMRSPALPIVFLTGYADLDELLPALGAGAVVLRKPLLLQEVVASITQVMAPGGNGP